jgi:hypothetical protein
MLSFMRDFCRMKKLTELMIQNVRKIEKYACIDIEALFTIRVICPGETTGLTCAFSGIHTDVLWSMLF